MRWGSAISLKCSIIIPALNEAAGIVNTLTDLQVFRSQGHELILVDGGSQDNTRSLARPWVDKLIDSDKGRAIQMNAGAAQATGDLLLFLHSDTRLPKDAMEKFSTLPVDGNIWGRFDVKLSNQDLTYRVIAFFINLRSRITAVATGDQAMFISKKLFMSSGGYPLIPLMEDVALSKILRSCIKPICFRSKVTTSARRWEENGVIKTVLLMWALRLAYFCGVSPDRLAKWYAA